jgi:hypothetical protein
VPDDVGPRLFEPRHDVIEHQQVELAKVKRRMLEQRRQVLALPEKKVVGAEDFVPAAQQARDQVRGDEARRTCDEHSHSRSRAARVRASSSGTPMS